jgi:hypothetical protein
VTVLPWLVWACGPARWSDGQGLERALARIDRDGDGRASDAEWDAVAYGGPASEAVDTDADGSVDTEELRRALASVDPVTWDGAVPGEPKFERANRDYFPDAPRVRQVRNLLLFLSDELRQGDPRAWRPTPEDIHAAAAGGTLDSAEARAVLVRLRAGFEKAGLPFPAGLVAGD